jgi:hypothetical protein
MIFPAKNQLHKRATNHRDETWNLIKWAMFHFPDHLNISQRISRVTKAFDSGKFRLSKRYNQIPIMEWKTVDEYPIRITAKGIEITFEEPYYEEEMSGLCGFCPPCVGFILKWKFVKNK